MQRGLQTSTSTHIAQSFRYGHNQTDVAISVLTGGGAGESIDAPERIGAPGSGARKGKQRRHLSPWRGSFSCAMYTNGKAKGDSMRPHRILSLAPVRTACGT